MFKTAFAIWNAKSNLAKLQYAYAVVVLFALMVAGLLGLLNQGVARFVLNIAGIATLAFLVNLVSFALINLIDIRQTPQAPTTRARK